MPTGKAPRPQAGFTYLLLMFVLAIGATGVLALGERWQLMAQREREVELLFRGEQIRAALARWQAHSPSGAGGLPRSLDQLLLDSRSSPPQHHLRQLYADPFTGQADWVLLRDAQGGIYGLASRSRRAALRRHGLPVRVAAVDGKAAVGDWIFEVQPRVAPDTRRSP